MDMKKTYGNKIINDRDNSSINEKLYISIELEKNVDVNVDNEKYDALIICSSYFHF